MVSGEQELGDEGLRAGVQSIKEKFHPGVKAVKGRLGGKGA